MGRRHPFGPVAKTAHPGFPFSLYFSPTRAPPLSLTPRTHLYGTPSSPNHARDQLRRGRFFPTISRLITRYCRHNSLSRPGYLNPSSLRSIPLTHQPQSAARLHEFRLIPPQHRRTPASHHGESRACLALWFTRTTSPSPCASSHAFNLS